MFIRKLIKAIKQSKEAVIKAVEQLRLLKKRLRLTYLFFKFDSANKAQRHTKIIVKPSAKTAEEFAAFLNSLSSIIDSDDDMDVSFDFTGKE